MNRMLGLSVVLAVAPVAFAADIEAGKAKAATVCAACHGATGVSVSDCHFHRSLTLPARLR